MYLTSLMHVTVLYCLLFPFSDFRVEIFLSPFAGRVGVHELEDWESGDRESFEVLLYQKPWFKHHHYGKYLERNITVLWLTHHWFWLQFWEQVKGRCEGWVCLNHSQQTRGLRKLKVPRWQVMGPPASRGESHLTSWKNLSVSLVAMCSNVWKKSKA